jgi:hypothetical protein
MVNNRSARGLVPQSSKLGKGSVSSLAFAPMETERLVYKAILAHGFAEDVRIPESRSRIIVSSPHRFAEMNSARYTASL